MPATNSFTNPSRVLFKSVFATRPFGSRAVVGHCRRRGRQFPNVVVYRVPLGLNLLRPPSHCPGCKRRIRSRDNIPVVSWLILRGRCRYCHTPISARYPIVEAATALMFAALAAGEYAAAGNNLPLQTDWASQGAAVFWSTKQLAWPLYWLFLYHLLLLTTLFCAGLMEIDGHRLPVRLYLPALLAGLTTAAIAAFTRPGSLWRIWRHAVIGDAMTDLSDVAAAGARRAGPGGRRHLVGVSVDPPPGRSGGPISGPQLALGLPLRGSLLGVAGRTSGFRGRRSVGFGEPAPAAPLAQTANPCQFAALGCRGGLDSGWGEPCPGLKSMVA